VSSWIPAFAGMTPFAVINVAVYNFAQTGFLVLPWMTVLPAGYFGVFDLIMGEDFTLLSRYI